jgi:toxin ParE1/3/4
MRLRYTRPALADLDNILQYIAVQSPHHAVRAYSRIQAILDLLLTYPNIGATLPYPYLIFYEIAGDEVVVHAVRHAARNPDSMPSSS